MLLKMRCSLLADARQATQWAARAAVTASSREGWVYPLSLIEVTWMLSTQLGCV